MKGAFGVLLVLFAAHDSLGAELRGSPEDLKEYLRSEGTLVRVVGESEIVAYSDTAVVAIVVSTRAKTLSEALQSNSRVRDVLTRALTDSGFDGENIKNAQFSSSPQYGLFGKKPNSFEVVNRLTVHAEDEPQLRRISVIVDETDEATIGSVDFQHSRKAQLQTQSELEALDDATRTAQQYADRLGMKLVPRSFAFDWSHAKQSQSSMVIEEIVVTAAMRERDSADRGAPQAARSFDEVRYESKVTVTFEVVESCEVPGC